MVLFSPSRLMRLYACDNCQKVYENLKTEDVFIEKIWKHGKRCPDCGQPCIKVAEGMT